jgi:hypothetical protein
MKRALPILCISFSWLCSQSPDLFAAAEFVTVVKVLEDGDKGIIQRSNGERWLIEKGVGAISFWRYEGKKVLISSPGIFCGVGSKVILPDADQEARIWKAERLSGDVQPVVPSKPAVADTVESDAIRATALALVTLKYFDPKSDDEAKRDPIRALKRFQADNKVNEGAMVGPLTLAKLAELVLRDRGASAEGLELVRTLTALARQMKGLSPFTISAPDNSLTKAAAYAGLGAKHWVNKAIGQGAFILLEDGSLWEISPIDKIKTMLWLPTSSVVVIAGKNPEYPYGLVCERDTADAKLVTALTRDGKINLYDSGGNAVAYIALDQDLTIYLWSGKPCAYLVDENIYGFNGKHLGWFRSWGWVYDHDGHVVAALAENFRTPVQSAPLKGLKELRPLKSLKELKPLKPLFCQDWSSCPAKAFFLGGAE